MTDNPTGQDSGLKTVPREPTIEMLVAGRKQTFADMTGEHMGPSAENTWKAMFDAAMSQASPPPLDDEVRLAQAISGAAYDEMRRQGFSGGWDHDEFGRAIARAILSSCRIGTDDE